MHNLQLLAKALNINLEVLTGNKEEDASFEILTASQVKIFADITNMVAQTIIEQNVNLSIGAPVEEDPKMLIWDFCILIS